MCFVDGSITVDGERQPRAARAGAGAGTGAGTVVPGAPGGPLRKALTVLETLAEASRPLTLSELSRLVNLPKSTLHRLMRALTDMGLAVRRESKSYELGTYLSRLAATRGPAGVQRLSYPVTPFLIELFQLTHRIVSLGTLSGTRVQHVGTLYGQEHVRLAMALRQPVPAHRSAAGKLLLAMDQRDPADLFDTAAADLSMTRARTDAMRREFDRIRRTGLSYARSECIPDLVELAAPVRLGKTGPLAAVVVGDTVNTRDLRGVARVLLDTVDAIEQQLADAC
ncbi:IclR family transcriptional regulator [Streptomyces daghestanicus]|uniref:IclR family transcriptional regulator n=2 Tax=Streptomyces TaxID=1883 RepID=A0A918LH21_STRGD|nr:IclR family transcriptional regulator [Streptomyces niveoruber]GGS80017.1 IclR family transcriptional regulator [Streptomyces griseoviridis]GGU17381.1 IclR family transcriptional regulator [Streptomyces daghestanicus]GHI35475.1 IclR family transcriptional regulator [Streptomyces daghestanicus]